MTDRITAWTRVAVVVMLCAIAPWIPGAHAHEFKLDAVMNAFVKIDPTEAQLVIRAPLYVFKAVKFPIKNAEIDVDASGPALEQALEAIKQDVQLFEDGRPLKASAGKARLTLPSDRSFEDYGRALSHVGTSHEPGTNIVVDQGYVDARLTYPIGSPNSVFSIRTTAAQELGDYLKLTLRYIPVDGSTRAMVITSRSGEVALNPTWLRAASGFVGFGITHIVTGYDHLLFLLCLIIPLRGVRQLLTVITGFTIAHSFTLIGSALNLAPDGAWFPPFVEFVIAVSIVYMALEDIIGVDLRRRLLLTMLFGLAHGFGFSYGLREDLQFAGSHLIVSLLAFNVGIELGQLIVLAVMLPALALVTRYVLPGRIGTIILAAVVAHTGWHWMTERWDALMNVRWPRIDAANMTTLMLWLAGLAIAGGLIVAIVSRLRLDAPAPNALPPRPATRGAD